jgi:hypothetical protein
MSRNITPPAKQALVPMEKPSTGGNIIDVLDHVLDKGIVIDAHVRLAVAGIDLVTVEAQVLVASIETYLQHAEAVRRAGGFVDGRQLISIDGVRNPLVPGGTQEPQGRPATQIGSTPPRKTHS